MEISGKIKKIFDEQTFPSGFRKKEIVVTTQEQYPQDLLVEFTQDRVEILNNYALGDEVKVSINLRGREWINPEGIAKYFNSINGWRIEKVMDTPPLSGPPISELPPITPDYADDGGKDDLPF